MLNNMPYLDDSNRLLLAPSDFLTPWKHGSPSVQEIPVTKLKSLEEARRMLTTRQVHMRKIKAVEMATESSRFKNSFLKLGKNKKIESLTAGCVVLVNLKDHNGPEMGMVQSLDRGNVIIKLCNRMLTHVHTHH